MNPNFVPFTASIKIKARRVVLDLQDVFLRCVIALCAKPRERLAGFYIRHAPVCERAGGWLNKLIMLFVFTPSLKTGILLFEILFVCQKRLLLNFHARSLLEIREDDPMKLVKRRAVLSGLLRSKETFDNAKTLVDAFACGDFATCHGLVTPVFLQPNAPVHLPPYRTNGDTK